MGGFKEQGEREKKRGKKKDREKEREIKIKHARGSVEDARRQVGGNHRGKKGGKGMREGKPSSSNPRTLKRAKENAKSIAYGFRWFFHWRDPARFSKAWREKEKKRG